MGFQTKNVIIIFFETTRYHFYYVQKSNLTINTCTNNSVIKMPSRLFLMYTNQNLPQNKNYHHPLRNEVSAKDKRSSAGFIMGFPIRIIPLIITHRALYSQYLRMREDIVCWGNLVIAVLNPQPFKWDFWPRPENVNIESIRMVCTMSVFISFLLLKCHF